MTQTFNACRANRVGDHRRPTWEWKVPTTFPMPAEKSDLCFTLTAFTAPASTHTAPFSGTATACIGVAELASTVGGVHRRAETCTCL